jgi:hypothetical protein
MVRHTRRLLTIGALALALTAHAGNAGAVGIPLSDLNSTVTINPYSQSGVTPWYVDGIGQLWSQWFWFRAGSSGPERSLEQLGPPTSLTAANTNLDPGDDTLTALYTSSGALPPFTVEVEFSLQGSVAGSKTSDLSEAIRITNTGTSGLSLHFFQYNDFDLTASATDDHAKRVSANVMEQWDSWTVFREEVTTTAPDGYEIGPYNSIITSLNDGLPTTLSNSVPTLGPADITWAWQWDLEIGAGETATIGKNKHIEPVPNPATLLLLGTGLLGAAFWGRRRLA